MLLGEAGDDHLDGGEGVNYHFGGSGNDTFVARDIASVQVVQDWKDGADVVRFEGSGFSSLDDVISHSYQNGAYLVVQVDGDTAVWLANASAQTITASDFLFV